MPNPYGNPGNKGGGRKSAYVEHENAQWLKDGWKTDTMLEKLANKIRSGKYSVRDMFLYKALLGDPKIIATFSSKLLPDLKSILIDPNSAPLKTEVKMDFFDDKARAMVKEFEDKFRAVAIWQAPDAPKKPKK